VLRQCLRTCFLDSRRSSSIINDMTQPKQELQTSLANLDKHITATVHARLSNIHANDASLTKQTKTLQSRTHEARKHQDSWDTIVRAGRNGMKVLSHTTQILTSGLGRRSKLGKSTRQRNHLPRKCPSANRAMTYPFPTVRAIKTTTLLPICYTHITPFSVK